MKKQSQIRTWFQAAWFVLTNSYFRGYTKGMIFTGNTKVICLPGLNCYSCPGALGACPMGSLQAVMGDSAFRVSLYVFGMLAAIGALFGRLVCGWMCPFGLFQDLLHKIPLKLKKKNLPGHKYLKYLKYVILIVFPILLVSIVTDMTGTSSPWFCEWICPSGTLLGGIPLVAVNSGLREAAGFRFVWKMAILIVITILAIIYYRPFCKYLCPLGASYSLFNPVSSYRLVIDKDKCVTCGTCQKACGMDIRTFETPNSLECIRCGSCMSACPVGAISSTWGQTGQKIKKRCLVDEETAATAASRGSSLPLARKTAVYGVMTLITGLVTIIGNCYVGLISNMMSLLTVEVYQEMNNLYLLTFLLWTIASVLLVIAGIYAIRHRNDPEAALSAVEKAKAALWFEITGLIVSVVGIIMDLGTLMLYFQPSLLTTPFFIGVPIAVLMGAFLRKDACRERDGKSSGRGRMVLWIFLILLWILNLLMLPLILTGLHSLTA
ncbi:MAG: 4Fe-4S binding protein [Mogibacterium sp.]|nr:4Fe-4S binding protein [Mogibacterium sp.]